MKAAREAGRYTSVAVQSAVADWLVFSVLVGLGAHELAAQGTSRLVGGGVSFVANKLWAFQTPGAAGLASEIRRFLALYVFSYVLSLSVLALGSDGLGMSPWIAKGLADTTCFLVNFVVMRSWVFRASEGVAQPDEAHAGSGEQAR